MPFIGGAGRNKGFGRGGSNFAPTWNNASGEIFQISTYSSQSANNANAATDLEGMPLTYSIISGSLPPGLSLNSSSGQITGTPSDGLHSNGALYTDYPFTARVADPQGNNVDRAYSIRVNVPYRYRVIVNRGIIGGGYQGPNIYSSITRITTTDNSNGGSLSDRGNLLPWSLNYGGWSQDRTYQYSERSGQMARCSFSTEAVASVTGTSGEQAPGSGARYGDDNTSTHFWKIGGSYQVSYQYSSDSWSTIGLSGGNQGGHNYIAGMYNQTYYWGGSSTSGNWSKWSWSTASGGTFPAGPRQATSHPKCYQSKDGAAYWTSPSATNIDRFQMASDSWVDAGGGYQPAIGSEDSIVNGQDYGYATGGWGNSGPWGQQHPYGKLQNFSNNTNSRQSTIDSPRAGLASASGGWGRV